jgi:3-phenylpropionate/cinnamic acid dioxygenase small subunit
MMTTMDAQTLSEIERAFLSHGLFRRYSKQRFVAAEEFASHGYTVEDLNRLAAAVANQKPRNHSAALAAWLKDADGGLHERILSLRTEMTKSNEARERQLRDLDDESIRELTLRGIGSLVSDGWALASAVDEMNSEFRLADPITLDEAESNEIVSRHMKTPSQKSLDAIQAMVDRARAKRDQ